MTYSTCGDGSVGVADTSRSWPRVPSIEESLYSDEDLEDFRNDVLGRKTWNTNLGTVIVLSIAVASSSAHKE